MLFRFDNSISPNWSLTIEFVSHGDPRDCCEDCVCCGFFSADEAFWNTLQTTHSSCENDKSNSQNEEHVVINGMKYEGVRNY